MDKASENAHTPDLRGMLIYFVLTGEET